LRGGGRRSSSAPLLGPARERLERLEQCDGETIAFFAGAIKDQPVDGVLRALTDDDHVTDITLMVRPWAALKAGIVDIKI
jgi:hypothetical protein